MDGAIVDILLSVIAIVLGIVGSIGCIVPVLPGGLLTYAGYLCLYFCSYTDISIFWPILFGVLTVVAATLDFLLPSYMTKKFGGTKSGEVGATVGSLGGCLLSFFMTPLIIIVGLFTGAVVGELLNDKNDKRRAFKSGIGSFLSFFVGSGIRLIVSAWITIDIVVKVCAGLGNVIGNLF